MSREEGRWLLSARDHLHILSTRRALMIVSRVRLLSLVFAAGLLLWIAVDLALLPGVIAWKLALLRVVAALGFATLVPRFRERTSMRSAYAALASFFFVTTAFIAAASMLINLSAPDVAAASALAGYGFLPFAMLALLGMFPLTVMECAAFGAPLLLYQALSIFLNWNVLPWASPVQTFWLLMVIVGVAVLCCISQLGFAIALVRQSMRDPLTHCFTRQSGMELLELQFINSVRSRAPLCVAFLDIDNFKAVNDRFGHEAGDGVLNAFAERVRAIIRSGDVLVRWGGEEFVLILPDTDVVQARFALDRLRQHGLGLRPDGAPVTVSIGLAERSVAEAPDWPALVRLADQYMYAAKAGGRDRVVYAQALQALG